jgi:hypothetical protein
MFLDIISALEEKNVYYAINSSENILLTDTPLGPSEEPNRCSLNWGLTRYEGCVYNSLQVYTRSHSDWLLTMSFLTRYEGCLAPSSPVQFMCEFERENEDAFERVAR